jgi:hypothetical protein
VKYTSGQTQPTASTSPLSPSNKITQSGTLISCPICRDKKPVLGRLTESGQFIVLRFHHGTTLITSDRYSIQCGCGYTVNIHQGTVVTTHNNE